MRVEISHKFIIGFLVVIVSGVVVNLAVPSLKIPPEFQQFFSITCALVVGLIIGAVFSRAFADNIRRLKAAGERISHGDLSEDVTIHTGTFPDETMELAEAMNQFQASLRDLVGDIRTIAYRVAGAAQNLSGTSQQMSASAQEVAGTVDQISKGAETQAAMIEESNRLFKNVAVSIERVSMAAKEVSNSADQTLETACSGNAQANTSLNSIRQVLAEAESSGQQMVNFIAQLHKITNIVEVINGIARKTNLLALNATIEAARAGEYGRGFTVVAEEIRHLADSTTVSADEISALVQSIGEEGQHVQTSMAQVIEEMESGREAVDRTSLAFAAITRNAEGTRTKASSIADLAEEQITSAQRIHRAIDEIDKVVAENATATQEVSAATQEQSAAMEDMAAAAHELSSLSETMLKSIQQFKLVPHERD